jgi:hypothetical protein
MVHLVKQHVVLDFIQNQELQDVFSVKLGIIAPLVH